MITLQKHFSHLVAVLTAVALAGCVKGDQANQSADSTARNLTLAPTESTAAMKDVPATTTERAKPAPEKKAPQPAPKPATPVVPKTLTAAAGTRVPLAASESISTRQAKPGDAFSATVGEDVKDGSGRGRRRRGRRGARVARHRRGAAEGRHHHHQADEATDGEAGLMIGGARHAAPRREIQNPTAPPPRLGSATPTQPAAVRWMAAMSPIRPHSRSRYPMAWRPSSVPCASPPRS